MRDPGFDYFYGGESEQFSFYRIPRQLIVGPEFKHVSTDAKLLYGLIQDKGEYKMTMKSRSMPALPVLSAISKMGGRLLMA